MVWYPPRLVKVIKGTSAAEAADWFEVAGPCALLFFCSMARYPSVVFLDGPLKRPDVVPARVAYHSLLPL